MQKRVSVRLKRVVTIFLVFCLVCANFAGFWPLWAGAQEVSGNIYYVYLDGVKVASGMYVELSGTNIKVSDTNDGIATYEGTYDGYVKVVTKEQQVTVIPYAAEGYEFSILNLTDEVGNVCTPLSRDYRRTADGRAEQIQWEDGTTGYTFTIDADTELDTVTESNIGLIYKKMPKIMAYFDLKEELLNDQLEKLVEEDSNPDILTWIDGSIHAGMNDWTGIDINGGSAVFYAGEDYFFDITGVVAYGRYNWADSRFKIKVEGSINGTDWEVIMETKNRPRNEKLSTAREKISTQNTYKYLRLTPIDYPATNISLLKIYGNYRHKDEIYFGTLDDVLAKANEIKAQGQRNYTDDTWKPLLEAIETAEALYDKAEGEFIQGDVEQAIENLTLCMEQLAEPLPVFVNNEGMKLNHPAINISGEQLLRVREHIINKDEPWYSYYQVFANSEYASKSYSIRNDANPDSEELVPLYGYNNYNTGFFNNQMSQDATAAYYQSLMYFFTGDKDYREKAIRIVRLWSLVDPSEATFVVDAHIQMSYPVYYLNCAAEMLRYTSTFEEVLVWTDADTKNWITNFLTPPLEIWFNKNNYFLNQHQTALQASMSTYIFMDDRENYERTVEWFTVNSTYDGSDNGSLVNALPEFVDDEGNSWVTITEMGRDQPHASMHIGTNVGIANMLISQGTKVDPILGTVSEEADAVGIYEFGNNKFLRAANTFCAYNLGYDVPYPDGLMYDGYSDSGRGRIFDYYFGQVYYYYKYVAGYEDTDPDMKYFAQSMQQKYDISGATYDDIFIYIPDEAAGTAIPQQMDSTEGATASGPFQMDTRYTAFDENSETKTDSDGTRYLRVNATSKGSEFTMLGIESGKLHGDLALRIRTNGIVEVGLCKNRETEPFRYLNLPDTDNEWKYIEFTVGDIPAATFPADYSMLHFLVKGDAGVTLDIDYLMSNDSSITTPDFGNGVKEISVNTFRGAELSYSLAATDSDISHTISYNLDGVVENGMAIDENGTFTWILSNDVKPDTYSVFVNATDGDAITVLKLTLEVYSDYMEAVDKIVDGVEDKATYESESYAIYEEAYQSAVDSAQSDSAEVQNAAIQKLSEAVESLRILNPKLSDGSLDYTDDRVSSNISSINAENLTDNDGNTFTGDIWGSSDKTFILDFGANYKVIASEFRILPRNGFNARSEGIVVFGSNDGMEWIPLTDLSIESGEWQSLKVYEEYQSMAFQYLKFKDVNGGVVNREETTEDQPLSIGELRIVGDRIETVHKISEVRLKSLSGTYQAERDGNVYVSYRAGYGDDVTLVFDAEEELQDVHVTICGSEVEVSVENTDDGKYRYTATYVVSEKSPTAKANITIDYLCADGLTRGDTIYRTTDESSVLVSNEKNLIDNVLAIATPSVYEQNWDLKELEKWFDGDYGTNTETRVDGSGARSYYNFDFGKNGTNYSVHLDRIEILDRVNWTDRVAGTFVQASNDGVSWLTISENSATATNEWQVLKISDKYKNRNFRYIRIMNNGYWYGNLSEVRFFGEYGADLVEKEPVTYTVSTKPSNKKGGSTLVYPNLTGTCPSSPATGNETVLTGLEHGTSVAVTAIPAEGYRFVKWTQEKVVDGLEVDYILSEYPVYTICQYDGGYLGGTKTYAVVEDMELTAWFEKLPVETGELQKAIAEAEKIESDSVTEESYKIMQSALEKAKAVLADEDSIQKDVDNALAELQEAMDHLDAIETPDDPQNPDDSQNPDDLQNPDDSQNSDISHNLDSPETGDDEYGMLVLMMMFSCVAMVAFKHFARKKT